ncbi:MULTISPECIES: class I SAM-dependent methyltransferase [Micrococcaceae]|mgnify:CR=1 FL=1|uniref:class I SAM-dependent methyltransferase n=1 Tax=Micrococcaceae TaxID=1268 RepID=UPI00183E9069|nr:class I SAM-dependent methyltransferase [Citricoccus sp.]MBB5748748.1 SAM-dependent methyltransferase [Micrococcus sp. TA1]HRO29020.1 class I SAM-dependent methyltransferase [Citricoccus sp.]HRO93376.1 class I SAM-dependent methyltransferase [Citricoccus sp.]
MTTQLSSHQTDAGTASAPPVPEADPAAVAAFAERCVGFMNQGAIALLISVGHQAGLFELMVRHPGSTSQQLADTGHLDERYVREWLAGMVTAGIVRYHPDTRTHVLPPEHAAVLTESAGPDNMAHLMQYIGVMGRVEQPIVERFHHGGGLSYADYPDFHRIMAQESAAVNDASLIDGILPLVEGLPERLEAGIDVADIGCGSGHAINLMAAAYPGSRFTGYDFSADAIATARREAAEWGLDNARFEVLDVAALDVAEGFDAITAFDAIHDQAHPARVLGNIHRALRPGGVFLMVDIRAESQVEDNLSLPWASYLYAISMFHCMSVSLGLGGDGLGTVWGRQVAERMVSEAGFTTVEAKDIATDPFNTYYVASKD